MAEFMRPLGDTGLTVSALGLGTVKIGRNQGVKYPSGFELPDDKAVRELLALAKDLGINLLDTAPAYGSSEERLGQLLAQRQDWVLVSKVGEEFENGQSHFDFTPEHVQFSVARSLKRLNTDYLDAVLVHSDGNDLEIINRFGTLDALAELKQRGVIRAFGFSGKTVEGGLAALQKSDIAMVTANLDYRDEQSVIDYAAGHTKGILIKKAFASGHLSGGIEDPVQATFDMLLQDKGVSSIIIGTITPAHLISNTEKARRTLQSA